MKKIFILVSFLLTLANSRAEAQIAGQQPPPSNTPNSVSVGTPNYYYYYVPVGTYPAYPTQNPTTPQTGYSLTNKNGKTSQTFWYVSPTQHQNISTPSSYPSFYGAGGVSPYTNGGVLYIP